MSLPTFSQLRRDRDREKIRVEEEDLEMARGS
jgi:hypothetical protein